MVLGKPASQEFDTSILWHLICPQMIHIAPKCHSRSLGRPGRRQVRSLLRIRVSSDGADHPGIKHCVIQIDEIDWSIVDEIWEEARLVIELEFIMARALISGH